MPRARRRFHGVQLLLTPQERDALDRQVDKHGVPLQVYLRKVIELTDRGEMQLPPHAFDQTL